MEKIKKYLQHTLLPQLRDVRVVGLIVFGIIALLVTWSTLGAIQTNYELQQQVARLKEENKVQKLENTNLALRNEYYNTEQYLELTARRQFGLGAPGEKVLLVPENVALSKTVDIDLGDEAEDKPGKRPEKPGYQRNFEAWINFLFRPEGDS
ncbi:hypothetical protein BH23PAT1_BH23PAT1_1740 [soil metagenome]